MKKSEEKSSLEKRGFTPEMIEEVGKGFKKKFYPIFIKLSKE